MTVRMCLCGDQHLTLEDWELASVPVFALFDSRGEVEE